MSPEPRAHLYVFAHRALPTLGLQHAKQMLGALGGPKCSDFLMEVWNDIATNLKPEERMKFPEIACSIKRQGNYLLATIHFPAPLGMTEPHFSAFVFGPIKEDGPLDYLGVRYLILEHSWSLETAGPRTVLGEWTKESHLNYGDGPAASVEAFEAAVWKAVQPTPA
jgi:hypothetical protein